MSNVTQVPPAKKPFRFWAWLVSREAWAGRGAAGAARATTGGEEHKDGIALLLG